MGFLANKRIVLTGLISNRSIAYGIAKACHEQGAELAFTYVGERFEGRVKDFAEEFGSKIVVPCDVSSDESISNCVKEIGEYWGDGIDGVVHSIGFAPRESIAGNFLDGYNRENFRAAHDISAYSFAALAKEFLPLVEKRQGNFLTLTYLGAERAITHYNMMGLAKASLESSVRYLAKAVGDKGIRVNGISAGPIKTLAAAGIKDFNYIFNFVEQHAPLKRGVNIDDVGKSAAFLLSDLASGVTGEILHVDAGFNAVVSGL